MDWRHTCSGFHWRRPVHGCTLHVPPPPVTVSLRAAENSVVVAEGELTHGGVFRAIAMGLPKLESREASFTAAKVSLPLAPATRRSWTF